MRKRKMLLAFGATALLSLSGCSSDTTSNQETAATTTPASTTAIPEPRANEAVEAPGVTLTVDGVSESDYLSIYPDSVKVGSAPEENMDAPEGGRFVTVTTTVENTGLVSWDLTCGFAIQAHIFSEKNQRYDPIDSLYRIPGNPSCNDGLNPGFSDTMIWAFPVPNDVEITHFGFADPETNFNDLTLIDISDAKPAVTSVETTSTTNETSTQATRETATTAEATSSVPQKPPFMNDEDFDPYGPPRFVECWESNVAVMSDGSIVTDTVNCAPEPAPLEVYDEPVRSDGCVGPAAVCGYYDEFGNPIWFDKTTGETSPRYYDQYGNPTMVAP